MNKKVLNLVLFSAAFLFGYNSYKLIKDNSNDRVKFEVIGNDNDNSNIIRFDETSTERKYITLRKAN